MKKHKRILAILMVTILVFLLVFLLYIKKDAFHVGDSLNVWNDTELSDVEVSGTECLETESVEELSYIERYGLEEVDKPEKRNEAQVLEKLAELAEEHELVRQVYENVDAYSKGMLEHLANNPEMAAFVLGSLESDGSVTGGFTEKELEEEFPLLLQFDPRWGYFEYGGKEMALSGCGPTCLAMTILALTDEEDVTPDKIVTYSLENGHYVENVGTAWKLMDEFPTLYGLSVEHPTLKEASMKAALDEGKVLICSVKKGVFTAGGHFIVIYGYNESGFMVNDPKCVARSRRTWTFEEFGNQLKRLWAIGIAEEAFETDVTGPTVEESIVNTEESVTSTEENIEQTGENATDAVENIEETATNPEETVENAENSL